MTFLEKAMEINKDPLTTEEDIMRVYCPSHFGLEEKNKCNGDDKDKCIKCWNREMPNIDKETEESLKILEAHNKAYERGLNDAWELARKIFTFNCNEMNNIFGFREKRYVFDELDVQEALAKLKEYEEAQSKIDIGDVVVDLNEKKGLVIGILPDEDKVDVWYEGDGRPQIVSTRFLTKTGDHINLGQIIKQIGE